MIFVCLISIIFVIAAASAGTSYQYVNFVNHKPSAHSVKPSPRQPSGGNRQTRSYGFYHHPIVEYVDFDDIWHDEVFLPPGDTIFDIDLNHGFHNHFTPPIYEENDIAPHDPLLLTGLRAKQTAQFLYGKGELFYKDIPHLRAILRLQQKRKENGLAPNRLGSLNHQSPFYRDKKHRY